VRQHARGRQPGRACGFALGEMRATCAAVAAAAASHSRASCDSLSMLSSYKLGLGGAGGKDGASGCRPASAHCAAAQRGARTSLTQKQTKAHRRLARARSMRGWWAGRRRTTNYVGGLVPPGGARQRGGAAAGILLCRAPTRTALALQPADAQAPGRPARGAALRGRRSSRRRRRWRRRRAETAAPEVASAVRCGLCSR